MPNRLLLLCAIMTLCGCEEEDNMDVLTSSYRLDEITINSIDEAYPDDTLIEGGPDVYALVYLNEELVAETEVYQNISFPQEMWCNDLPINFNSSDMGKELIIELYDRDPEQDDFIGELYWELSPLYDGDIIELVANDNNVALKFKD